MHTVSSIGRKMTYTRACEKGCPSGAGTCMALSTLSPTTVSVFVTNSIKKLLLLYPKLLVNSKANAGTSSEFNLEGPGISKDLRLSRLSAIVIFFSFRGGEADKLKSRKADQYGITI
jgi:hypothetical protein